MERDREDRPAQFPNVAGNRVLPDFIGVVPCGAFVGNLMQSLDQVVVAQAAFARHCLIEKPVTTSEVAALRIGGIKRGQGGNITAIAASGGQDRAVYATEEVANETIGGELMLPVKGGIGDCLLEAGDNVGDRD